ncbi:MAG: hypothetical protein IPM29_15870 [Planctomycetes bacterium]|nr:hypothetical protein [Planctomycetota bacterium]
MSPDHRPTLILAAVAALALAPAERDALPQAAPAPGPDSLLGASPEDVIADFGVPHEWHCGATWFRFEYEGPDGDRARFTFHADVAVEVPAAGFRPARIESPGADAIYAGLDVETAVRRLGDPTDVTFGTLSIDLGFADGRRVAVAHGRVFPSRG